MLEELSSKIAVIKNETVEEANTSERIGEVLEGIVTVEKNILLESVSTKAQALTDPQKAQARANIGAGVPVDITGKQEKITSGFTIDFWGNPALIPEVANSYLYDDRPGQKKLYIGSQSIPSVWTETPLFGQYAYRFDGNYYLWSGTKMVQIGEKTDIEIVNDLTTGGTNALSAEQGKLLGLSKMNRLQRRTGAPQLSTFSSAAQLAPFIALGFDLSGTYAASRQITNANFSGANFSGANFSGANLSGTNFGGSDLSNANLSRADASNASFVNTNLSNANLFSTILSGDMYSANLSGANLTNANLTNATLTNVNFSGANFSGAIISSVDINLALSFVNKNPNNGALWQLTWTDGTIYQCDPATGLFTQI